MMLARTLVCRLPNQGFDMDFEPLHTGLHSRQSAWHERKFSIEARRDFKSHTADDILTGKLGFDRVSLTYRQGDELFNKAIA